MVLRLGSLIKTLFAYFLYPFYGARIIGHVLGIIPYVPVYSVNIVRESFAPPQIFKNSALDPQPSAFWDRPKPSKVTRHHVVRVQNGQADQHGSVFDKNGRPIMEACHPLKQRWKYRWQKVRDGICVEYMKDHGQPHCYSGRVGVLTSANQHIYSHWLLDILPRIAKLQELKTRVDFVFLQHSYPFQIETIKSLNLLEEVNVINCAKFPWVSGDELIVPCHQIMFGYHHPRWVCHWLRERFLSKENTSMKHKRKIFISRLLANRRRMTNEEEIYAFLSQEGFERCFLEQLSFIEQVKLFQEADIVVAPHGSGLANLVFCHTGTKVIELFPARATDAYFRLSVDMNLTYRCLKTREYVQHPRVSDDFSITVEDIQETLHALRG